MGRSLRRVPGLGLGRRGRRPDAARRGRPGDHARPSRSARSRPPSPWPAPAACPSSTGCSAAGWCPARRSCWPASPASARARCCSRWRRRPRACASAPSTSPARSRRPRSGCAPTAPAGSTTSCSSPPRPTSARCSPTSRRSDRRCWSSTPCRPSVPSGIDGVPGGVTQVKEVAAALIRVAKTRNITTVLVGHVTKDGSIAGPRVLEHLVDVVLHFEGERNSRFRMLRAMKNRYGPVDEVGCFDLSSEGISAVTDPTGLFVEHHTQDVSGTCVAVTMEGRRPLLAEVQALLTRPRSSGPAARSPASSPPASTSCWPCCQRHARLRITQQRHLRRDRRRRQAPRPGRRPGHRGRRRQLHLACRRRAAPSRSARSASPASCAACATSPSGSRRPPGSASRSPWCLAVAASRASAASPPAAWSTGSR